MEFIGYLFLLACCVAFSLAKVNDEEGTIIFTEYTTGSVKSINLAGRGNITMLAPNGTVPLPTGVTYDRRTDTVYINSRIHHYILSFTMSDPANLSIVANLPKPGYTHAITVDSSLSVLYVTAANEHLIYKLRTDGSKFVNWTETNGPSFGVAVAEKSGYLYWSERFSGRIMRAPLTDSTQKEEIIVTSSPFGIYLNEALNTLYWCELHSGRVKSSSLNGSNVQTIVVITEPSYIYHITGLNDHLYVTSLNSSNLEGAIYDINEGSYTRLNTTEVIRAFGIVGAQNNSDINMCASNPCQNAGSCQYENNQYVCLCQIGYSGTYCEFDINHCSSSPCLNGADCENDDNGYICNCEGGYKGKHCELEKPVKQPIVHSVWPNFGPQSGGTNITIRGEHLPSHELLIVHTGTKECVTVYQNTTIAIVNSSRLEPSEEYLLEKNLPIYISIGNITNLTTNAVFMYKGDPVVASVYPKESIVEGGILLTAQGNNFESVAVVKMETTMILKKLITKEPPEYHETRTLYTTDCDVHNETLMLCVTPTIALPDEFINLSAETKRKRDTHSKKVSVALESDPGRYIMKREANQKWVTTNGEYTLEFYIGFRLDGVDDHKNFTLIDIHTEPVFGQGNSKLQFTKGERLAFKGQHLDRGVTIYDYMIAIGSGTCDNVELLWNSLSCLPPQIKPDDNTNSDPKIIIHIGQNVDHFAGHLIYPDKPWPLYVWVLIGVLHVVVIIVIIVTIAICVRRKRNDDVASTK